MFQSITYFLERTVKCMCVQDRSFISKSDVPPEELVLLIQYAHFNLLVSISIRVISSSLQECLSKRFPHQDHQPHVFSQHNNQRKNALAEYHHSGINVKLVKPEKVGLVLQWEVKAPMKTTAAKSQPSRV